MQYVSRIQGPQCHRKTSALYKVSQTLKIGNTHCNQQESVQLLNVVAMTRNKATYELFGKKYYIKESAWEGIMGNI